MTAKGSSLKKKSLTSVDFNASKSNFSFIFMFLLRYECLLCPNVIGTEASTMLCNHEIAVLNVFHECTDVAGIAKKTSCNASHFLNIWPRFRIKPYYNLYSLHSICSSSVFLKHFYNPDMFVAH